MMRFIGSVLLAFMMTVGIAKAQQGANDIVWIQVEAHPSLRAARERASVYSGVLPDVNGFSLGGSWYGVVLGPYRRADAERAMAVYRAERKIPQDSFIAFTNRLGQQFWPVGANILNQGAIPAPVVGQQPATEAVAVVAEPTPPEPSDESPAEARRSERDLTREQRMELQVAMKAAGFYAAAIDGAFGPGTRRSMRDWQSANNYESTGILTTLQRRVLMDQYNAPLISVGMRQVLDGTAGIEMQLPTKEVRFARYEPPFAHYDSTTDQGIKVLLISQPGEQATLYGLYDIMQTLEIVPLEGPRERRDNSFTLVGRGNGIVSYTQARLKDGHIKGFTLIWPTGDTDRRKRVLTEMKASFTPTDGVLDPAEGADAEQRIDLVSGLEVRKPKLSRSGFYIDADGTIITTTEVVQNCTRITLDQDYRAEVLTTDAALGVAILRPIEPLTPVSVARLRHTSVRLQSDIAVAGFSYEGALGAPTLTFGKLADNKGLRGETELDRLELAALPGDAGGPILDAGGSVLGMLLSPPSGNRKLPDGVSFTADARALRNVLDDAGVATEATSDRPDMTITELDRLASGMTVLVSCWD